MRRFFVKNILFVLAVNILVKPVWVLLIDRTVQNRVSPGEYGTYQALLGFSIIFQIILDFGITSYNTRTIAQNPGKLSVIFPSMLSARLVLMGVYVVLTYILGWTIGYRGWELHLLMGVLVIQSLNSLVAFIRSNISALHRFKTDGILSITDRLLMILICGFLLLNPLTRNHFRIQWFVIAQAACYMVTAIAAYIILRRMARVRLKFAFHLPTVLGIMRQSVPYAILIFQMSVYNRADSTMIERLGTNGKLQADVWASAFRLLDMANMVGLMFATMLLPLYGRMLSQKHDVQPMVKLCVNMLLPLSFAVSVTCIVFSNDIMHILYKGASGAGSADYRVVFSWLMASFPAWCMMYIYCSLLTANGNLKLLNFIALGGVILNLSLNFYLIPKFNATGGAITSFITQTTLALAFIVFSKIRLKLAINPKWIAAQCTYLIMIVMLAYGILKVEQVNWMIKAAGFMAICVLIMFIFRFISISGIRQLMNKEQ